MRRLSITLIAALPLFFSQAQAAAKDYSSYYNNLDKNVADVSQYKDINNKYSFTKNTLDLASMQYTTDTPIVREYYRKAGVKDADIDKFFEFIKNGGKHEKGTAIFFLTSRSVPKSNLRNFIVGFEKIKKKNPDLSGYFVFNGFIKHPGGMNKFLDDLDMPSSSVNGKILPFMFERLNVKKVPAFVISECPIVEFKQADCDHKIIATGNMPFEKFLDIVNEKSDNKKYKKLYYDLINPN